MAITFEKIEITAENLEIVVSLIKRNKGCILDTYCFEKNATTAKIVTHLYINDPSRDNVRLDLPLFGNLVNANVETKHHINAILAGAEIVKSGDKFYVNPTFVMPPAPKPTAEVICRI